ncbi:hypothetical protein OG371_03865 [Amycolatopsis sp. NBC_01480]|nr:hypothetical protein [Amycolatopsis sp. NBC_01480]
MEEGESVDRAELLLIGCDEPDDHATFLAQLQQVPDLVHGDIDGEALGEQRVCSDEERVLGAVLARQNVLSCLLEEDLTIDLIRIQEV